MMTLGGGGCPLFSFLFFSFFFFFFKYMCLKVGLALGVLGGNLCDGLIPISIFREHFVVRLFLILDVFTTIFL